MADELQAVLTAQLGETRAHKVYAAVLEAALHLREALVSGKALGAPGLDEGRRPDPEALLEARLRNTARAQDLREDLLADALSGRELATKLGISVQAIDQARRADKLIALRQGGSWRYPFWQLDLSAPDPVPPHLAELAKASGGLRLAVVRWLRDPDEVLGQTPLEALRSNRWRHVVRRARQLFVTAT